MYFVAVSRKQLNEGIADNAKSNPCRDGIRQRNHNNGDKGRYDIGYFIKIDVGDAI
jgi:hypothetical protein